MKKIILALFICFSIKAFSSNIDASYRALSIYDYFKAKALFYKSLKKHPSEAAFGLATIFNRTDNPFTNIDSAAKYIAYSKAHFKDTITIHTFHISLSTIKTLAKSISLKGFEKYCTDNSISHLNYFLSNFYFSDYGVLDKTYLLRDSLALENYVYFESSDSVTQFLLRYPESTLYRRAKKIFYDFEYTEQTHKNTSVQFKKFIKSYPNNSNIGKAESQLFELVKQLHQVDSLYSFIKNYSNYTKEEAWKTLYSLSVKNYTQKELTAFLLKYPDYPYNQVLLNEIFLSEQVLIPIKNQNDRIGFIDTLGNWVIKPAFDDAMPFKEGFAAVCMNDSCFYINKEGVKAFNGYYQETESYQNGVAIVKKDNLYFLVNRSGQFISKGYQDINNPSENLYVCKSNDLYGAINAKGEQVIPVAYKKLGDFKNGYAYYLSSHYGLVNMYNITLKPQWEWISDVDTFNLVIVKKGNKFGLMRTNEQLVLPTEYDYIVPCKNGIYLVVKNNLYGFYYLKEKCFITNVDFTYNSAYEQNEYTDGKTFKLFKNSEVALIDINGKAVINFGVYTNLFLEKNEMIRVQKNSKFGFLDKKIKLTIPLDFEGANDFINKLSIVSKGTITKLINKSGEQIYAIKDGSINYFCSEYYIVKQNGFSGLITSAGIFVLEMEYDSIESLTNTLFKCIKANQYYLYNSSTKKITKL